MSRILCTRDPNPYPNDAICDTELAAKLVEGFVGMLVACKWEMSGILGNE